MVDVFCPSIEVVAGKYRVKGRQKTEILNFIEIDIWSSCSLLAPIGSPIVSFFAWDGSKLRWHFKFCVATQ